MGLVASIAASCGGLGRKRDPPSPPPSPPRQASAPPPSGDAEPELVRVFRRFDTDGDGRISAAEMQKFWDCPDAEAQAMVAAADKDGDGFVSVEELGALMEGGDSSATLRAAFDEYDENKDGVITAEELRRMLLKLGLGGEDVTAERCAEIVAAVDNDGDGVISFDEFKAMMTDKAA